MAARSRIGTFPVERCVIMMKTLIELLDHYNASRPPIPSDIPFVEQTPLFSEGVTFPRRLERTLALNGSTYYQVARTEWMAIYEGPQAGMFEVIVIQVKPPSVCPSGSLVPWREVYPVPEQWGTYGWTFTSQSHRNPLQAARERATAMKRYGKEQLACN
jgi:hypothetical protein